MPMDFPDLKSLEFAAKVWKFRTPNEGESEDDYRNALANFVSDKDYIESQEIRHKSGWDKWTDPQKKDTLLRRGFLV